MILYNVTSSIDPEIADEWVTYMRDVYLPDVMATGFFIRSQLCRLLHEEEGGVTYAAQFYCLSTEDLEDYQNLFGPGLSANLTTRFPGQYVSFSTVLEVIE